MDIRKLLKTVKTGNFGQLTIALLVIIIVLLIVIIIKPELEKGKGWLGVKVRQDLINRTLVI